MAKRQNFIVGSTNTNTQAQTTTELNEGWNRYDVLYSGKLDGVFNAVSDYSNDSSNEIANAILSITGSQPTGESQSELAGALNQMRQDIETSSLTFKGYISTSEPSSSTYVLIEGNLWINSATLPTSFPIAATDIQVWNGTAWVAQSDTYTAKDFDFWRNVNDNEGYYWFGGQWVVMSTDMSTTYFTLNQTSGKWEIKSSVNLPGQPTAATPTDQSPDAQIATKKYIDDALAKIDAAELFDFKWRDALSSKSGWKNANDYGWITQTEAPSAYNHLYNDLRATQTGEVAELGNNTWAAIVFDGTQYIAISETGYVSTSTDGTTWATATQDANLASLYDGTWRAIDYDGTIFVALGENGYISTSSDGTTWSAPTQVSNLGANTWRGLAYGNSTWVAISDGGYISTSSDGTTWSVATQNSDLGSYLWNDVIYDGTKFVALGNTGYLSTSTNGTTWAAAYKGTNIGSKAWKNMTFAGTRYVVVGLAGWITTSTDLINWTTPVQPLGANQWRGIVYNGNSDVIAISQTGYIGFSADNGFSWYMAATTETETIAGITITFSRAPDGHKIITPDQTSNAEAIYAATGAAWYYIIDTAHLKFKLPRVNPNRELINASAPVLTDELKDTYINTHLDGTTNTVLATPVYDNGAVLYAYDRTVATGNQNTNLKADLANSTGHYQGKQYLYFYVGEPE